MERIDRIDSTFTGLPLSLMRCNCAIDDCTCRIDSKLFHLTNRTNRSNRQHFVHFSLIKWNFSDRQQIERCFVGWTLCDSIGHEWLYECKIVMEPTQNTKFKDILLCVLAKSSKIQMLYRQQSFQTLVYDVPQDLHMELFKPSS